VINADDLRNDIYVTVYGAEFAKSGNYEYAAELCDENENPIPVRFSLIYYSFIFICRVY
jgi:hypothetical protein